MKIRNKPLLVIDARLINTSGIGTVCQNTIPYLLDHYTIVLLGDSSELEKFSWAASCKIIDFRSEIYSLQEQLGLPAKMPKCDYFLSPHYNVPILPIKARRRIVIIHDVNHVALKNNLSIIKRIYASLVIKFALRLSWKIITVSEFSKKEILKFFPGISNSIQTIKLGVDKKHFRVYADSEKAVIKRKYNLPDKYILYVGNVKPHKNLQVLIKAYSLLFQENKVEDLKLVIVGKRDGFITGDNETGILIKKLNILNNILFTGYIEDSDLPLVYNNANLFVFPSLYEGFGLPPLEAMACGCPVIVSNAASLPEVCKDAALYFSPTNEIELSERILKILSDKNLRRTMVSKGFILANNYNWDTTAETLLNIIKL